MDNDIRGPAKIIADLIAENDALKLRLNPQINDDLTVRATPTAIADPVPVPDNFAEVNQAAPIDTPTDAIAVLALRIGDLEARISALDKETALGSDAPNVHGLIDHLYSTLGFRKPDADSNG